MFEALVLVCWMGNPNYCKMMEDSRGPYDDVSTCQIRLEEMKEDLLMMFTDTYLIPHAGFCMPPKVEEEKVST